MTDVAPTSSSPDDEPYDVSSLPLVAPAATTGLFEVFRL